LTTDFHGELLAGLYRLIKQKTLGGTATTMATTARRHAVAVEKEFAVSAKIASPNPRRSVVKWENPASSACRP
jgi:hypothetical protein